MRTRKTFIHEDGIYEGVTRLPEPREFRSKEIVSLDNPFDWYPEKEPTTKTEPGKIEDPIDFQLGKEYKMDSKIDIYNKPNNRDVLNTDGPNEEINNLAV